MTQKGFYGQQPQRCWLFFRFLSLALGSLLLANVWVAPFARGAEASITERSYPLPDRLEAVLQHSGTGANYFDRITPSPQGYLLWSDWPVQVYLEPSPVELGTAAAQRQAIWQIQAEAAIADWSRYLPLEMAGEQAQAQIVILRRQPPLRWESGQLSRARHGETRFRITPDRDAQGQPCLRHQQTVYVGDRQGPKQLRGTLRHELGHALGLWGHSPNPDDALYGGQIADPPEISQSDLNTLGQLYGQPTRLGCLGGLPNKAHGS